MTHDTDFVENLTKFFNCCYNNSQLPAIWKTANVTALHKKGDKSSAQNYRPISLTCILSKMFERIVRDHILDHILPYITNQQHGFLSGRSCVSNLLECMDTIYNIMNTGECVDILYLDFMKAFDSVSHGRLLSKLRTYGITGKMHSLI